MRRDVTTGQTTDPLAKELLRHIWYTTTTRGGKKPHVLCKCKTELADTNNHADHVAAVARTFIEAE